MGALYNVGFQPMNRAFLPTGLHNIIPERFRKYIPTYDDTVAPYPFTFIDGTQTTMMSLGIKVFPDQIFSSQRYLFN